MVVVVWLTDDTTVALLTVRPVKTLVEAVTPVDEPMENTPPDNSETPSDANDANDVLEP